MNKLGLVAGGGDLPLSLAAHCERTGRPFHVVRLRGFADPALQRYPNSEAGVAEIGKVIRQLKAAGCVSVCFAGYVSRPDFASLKPDLRGLAAMPGLIRAARDGDDALLRRLLQEFEKDGLIIEGAHEVTDDLLLPNGPLGRLAPGPEHLIDIERAIGVARSIGAMDVGQAAVSCRGLVLAVEAQEGTDAMLRRVRDLPEAIRGSPAARQGVLAKAPKPAQELRVDLPTIGVATLDNAAAAGLAGVVGEAGRVLLVNRDAVARRADELGLFVFGVEASG
ncbi:MAG: LpxI family protein [Caulobacterales bacterium]